MTASQPKPRVLVIGIGNAYRGDDAVGLVVAQRLQEVPLDHVIIVTTPRDGTALFELWRDADVVVLIDAEGAQLMLELLADTADLLAQEVVLDSIEVEDEIQHA